MNGKEWTVLEEVYFITHYPSCDNKVLAKELGRTVSALYGQASIFGLHKTEEAKHKYGCYLTGKEGLEYRYKEGSIPANKGKKISPETYKKMEPTMFKKGMKSHTALPVGTITIITNYKRGVKYKWIKLAEPNIRMMLHRHNWIKEHGSIPDKMNVVFKDDNSMNCDIENLELVSDADLMLRNTIHKQFPKDLVNVIQLLGQVKRKVKKL